jgi:hypothetical protein
MGSISSRFSSKVETLDNENNTSNTDTDSSTSNASSTDTNSDSLSTLNTLNTFKEESVKTILINQATCYQCNTSIVDRGICKCGNVEIYGGKEELGRRIKNNDQYGDCSLVEYRRV